MEIPFQDWADLVVRWFHITAGIAWIGSSFYFIWLDLSLQKNTDMPRGVSGENWSVHGGGFYHSQKYMVVPEKMPSNLSWFKYEAYSTWISGFFLLGIVYYWGAENYLIDSVKMNWSAWEAILISLVFLSSGWVIYDSICKSPIGKKSWLLAVVIFILIVVSAFFLSQIFSDRAAMLHVGAMIGSMMVGNVFFIIIPNQKKVISELMSGVEPSPKLGLEAKQRSTHNNYLTLPVLLIMISNHYPILFSQTHMWAVVGLILIIGGIIRHFFNTFHNKEQKGSLLWQFPLAIFFFIILVLLTSWHPRTSGKEEVLVSPVIAMKIIQKHCVSCHAVAPKDEDFNFPPAGVTLETINDVRRFKRRILSQAVFSKAMPLGNKTQMTDQERTKLGIWINSDSPIE